MYKVIDVNTWYRKSQYEWFKTFSNPCYGIDLRLDVTDVVKYSKETNTKFFINFIYILTKTLNSVDSMRLRIVNNEVRLYDIINPTYCVSKLSGGFANGKIIMDNDYKNFYDKVKDNMDDIKNDRNIRESYNEEKGLYDDYYFTCLPWLDYNSMSHPIPDNNKESQSCPRVCFGKYVEHNGIYDMAFNLVVSHVLVDGEELSKTLVLLQENLHKIGEFYK